MIIGSRGLNPITRCSTSKKAGLSTNSLDTLLPMNAESATKVRTCERCHQQYESPTSRRGRPICDDCNIRSYSKKCLKMEKLIESDPQKLSEFSDQEWAYRLGIEQSLRALRKCLNMEPLNEERAACKRCGRDFCSQRKGKALQMHFCNHCRSLIGRRNDFLLNCRIAS